MLLIFCIGCSQTSASSPSLKKEMLKTHSDCAEEPSVLAKWRNEGFDVVSQCTLQDMSQKKLSLNLQVVFFKGSQWTQELLIPRYLKLREVYKQCSLGVTLNFLELNSQLNSEVFNPGGVDEASTGFFGERLPSFENTVYMIHVEELADGVAAISGPSIRLGATSKLLNKNWISLKGLSGVADNLFTTEAHELGHNLFNTNHTDFKNLMGGWPWLLDSSITQDQCDSLNLNSVVNRRL